MPYLSRPRSVPTGETVGWLVFLLICGHGRNRDRIIHLRHLVFVQTIFGGLENFLDGLK